jgi:hypothetical protein
MAQSLNAARETARTLAKSPKVTVVPFGSVAVLGPVHQAGLDTDGRRRFKTVPNAGQYNGTEVCSHDGWQIIAVYDGSGNWVSDFIGPLTRCAGGALVSREGKGVGRGMRAVES